MKQANLFTDGAFARRADPISSHRAAARVNTSRLEGIVLAALRQKAQTGATTKELAAELQLPRDSVSPRMPPLEEKNLIRRTKDHREGAIVWKAIPDRE